MIDVTVLILNGTFSSTAIGPMEVFRRYASCGMPLRKEAGLLPGDHRVGGRTSGRM
jgi:hypothetical protein